MDDIAPASSRNAAGPSAARRASPSLNLSNRTASSRRAIVTPEDTNPFDTPSAAKEDTISPRGRELGRGERSFGAPSEPEPSARTPERENKDTPAEDEYDPRASERGFRSLFSSSRGPDRVQLKNDGADYVGDGFSRNERGSGAFGRASRKKGGLRQRSFRRARDGLRRAFRTDGEAPRATASRFRPRHSSRTARVFRARVREPFRFSLRRKAPRPLRKRAAPCAGCAKSALPPPTSLTTICSPKRTCPPCLAQGRVQEKIRESAASVGGGETSIPELPAPPAPKPKKHVYKRYRRPSLDLFQTYDDAVSVSPEEIEYNSSVIMETLAGFRVDAEVVKVTSGPASHGTIIDIPRNISVRSVIRHDEEIAMRLHARDRREYVFQFGGGRHLHRSAQQAPRDGGYPLHHDLARLPQRRSFQADVRHRPRTSKAAPCAATSSK